MLPQVNIHMNCGASTYAAPSDGCRKSGAPTFAAASDVCCNSVTPTCAASSDVPI